MLTASIQALTASPFSMKAPTPMETAATMATAAQRGRRACCCSASIGGS